MLRETLVEERVIGAQQIEHAAIFFHHTLEQQLGLAPEGLTEVVVEIGEQPVVRFVAVEIAQVQPLCREVVHQCDRARVREHPAHLLLEHGRFVEPSFDRNVEQRRIRNAAPEEERESRG